MKGTKIGEKFTIIERKINEIGESQLIRITKHGGEIGEIQRELEKQIKHLRKIVGQKLSAKEEERQKLLLEIIRADKKIYDLKESMKPWYKKLWNLF